MLEVVREGPILHVWLNRPAKLNALDDDALTELAEVFTGLQRSFDVKVVVLGGRGRSFCAGADLGSLPGVSGIGERERRWHGQVGYRACQAIADCDVVTVARLHGHVLGGGLALALACDFRIATADASFGLPEVQIGLPLTWGTVPRLVSEIGAARARDLVMLGTRIDTATAEQYGIVHRSTPADGIDDAVRTMAERIVATPEYALHTTKSQFQAYARPLGDPTYSDGDAFIAGTAFRDVSNRASPNT
ncbi:enoyl-CoA hydratase/isomerase family protein [Antrihabitans sp. YC3-6]|uniref:Enoyl-CoA hydratase/isomerase family protein n=1 Tax=Antrihabitans stalagmiti TaxID=2799499 RepID=A0A934NUF5_9NOCA|nr:enoyl-CoA hydratase/isomerase family protein [Antrihabitans stalagmiti]MBJ8341803.1 enoyl-CoA hydratase/isomerase family protein [Antrihabitans stalagmiti]